MCSDRAFWPWARHQANNETIYELPGHKRNTANQRRQICFFGSFDVKGLALDREGRNDKAWTFKVQDIEKISNEFVNVYANDVIMGYDIIVGKYQVLSPLLYCKQLQLNEAEYYQKPGLITVNVTISTFSIFDFYKIPPSQVRVCVEDYLRKSKGKENKTSGKAVSEVSYGLFISTFVIVMLVLSAF